MVEVHNRLDSDKLVGYFCGLPIVFSSVPSLHTEKLAIKRLKLGAVILFEILFAARPDITAEMFPSIQLISYAAKMIVAAVSFNVTEIHCLMDFRG